MTKKPRGNLGTAVNPQANYRTKQKQEFIPATAATDEERLQQLEHAIEEGFKAFALMGRALRELQETKLYRLKGFETFEEYCLQEWDIQRRRAYQLIDAAKVMENVKECPQLPLNESQARALHKLPPDKQREVWETAVKDAEKPSKITAKDLQEKAKNYLADSIEQPRPNTTDNTPKTNQAQPKETLQPQKTTEQLLSEIKKKVNDKTDDEIIRMALEKLLKSFKA